MKTSFEKLTIRADATTQIGTGHVMRCLALAQAWKEKGGEVVFLSDCESEALQNRIIDEGFDLLPIEKPHPDPNDLTSTLKFLSAKGNEISAASPWFVLDGYHFTPDYQKAIRDAGIRLLVIDDMNHLPNYHADIILNQNINAERLHYACEPDTRLLLGTKYALLRKEFWPWARFKRAIPEVARKILVTMGGSDPDNVTLEVIEAIKLLNMPEMEVQVVIGPSNPYAEELKNAVLYATCSMLLVQNVTNMTELMAWADVAVTAGGSTCWELAFMGLPSTVLVLAENQKSVAQGVHSYGAAISLGWYVASLKTALTSTMEVLITNPQKRLQMSKKGFELVKGRGIEYVLEAIIQTDKIRIRRAESKDVKLLWRWANDPIVRENSFRPELISLGKHLEWFQGKITSTKTLICILEFDHQPIGQIRFDRLEEDVAEVDFAIEAIYRGRGFGTTLLKRTSMIACEELGVKYLKGVTFASNKNAGASFHKAGFEKIAEQVIANRPCEVFTCSCQDDRACTK